MSALQVSIGRTVLKNPLIAGSAEHLIEADGVRRALRAGVGAVVVKSTNESERGRDQLQRAEYMLLDDAWHEIAWTPDAPATAFIACRSGLTPQDFAGLARADGAARPRGQGDRTPMRSPVSSSPISRRPLRWRSRSSRPACGCSS